MESFWNRKVRGKFRWLLPLHGIGSAHNINSLQLIQVEGFSTHFIKHQVFCLFEPVVLSVTLFPKHLIQCCLPSHFQLPIQEYFIKERRVISSLTMAVVYVTSIYYLLLFASSGHKHCARI